MTLVDRFGSSYVRTLLFLGLLVPVAGCALRPDSAPWKDDQTIIRAQVPPPQGSLVVETEVAGSPQDGETPHQRFYVYDQNGRYLTYFPNDTFLPIGLPVGRYVIVSRYSGRNKRVQVEIQDGCTTHVPLDAIKKAPAAE